MPDSEYWPEFENAVPRMSPSMPKEVASMANRRIRPMNWLDVLMVPGASAITHPNGTIAYNKAVSQAAMQTPEEILAHELTHVRQINNRGGVFGQIVAMLRDSGTPYGDRADEREAFAAEERAASRRGGRTKDIDLPRGR